MKENLHPELPGEGISLTRSSVFVDLPLILMSLVDVCWISLFQCFGKFILIVGDGWLIADGLY